MTGSTDDKGPLVIAHRGASALAPENTIAAFRRAIAAGADGVEFDVRLAADGVPVVIHDATIERTSRPGNTARVADLTSNELGALDAGSWFNRANPKLADDSFDAASVPTLEGALDALRQFKGLIYIELKCDSDAEMYPLADAVAGVIRRSSLLPNVIVKSFSLGIIPRIRCNVPEIRTAALFAPQIKRFLRKEKYVIDIARQFGADHLSLHRALVSRKLIKKAAKAALPVTIWTVDNVRWLDKAADLGIFALITNDPEKMLKRRT